MSLTGLPLILLTGVLAVLAVVATVRGWKVSGRKRLPLRISGLVAIEVLTVACIGLVANRDENFYPSWQALGDVENAIVVPPEPTGRLDGTLTADTSVAWSPPNVAAWHLAAAPLLITPPDYVTHPDHTFPVIVALTTSAGVPGIRQAVASTAGVLTVVLEPTHATTAASLGTLRGLLGKDARAADNLVILADSGWASLASAWPGRPTVIPGHTPEAFATATRDLPTSLAPPQRLPS